MADDLAEDLEHSPNVFGAALKGLFAHVPHEAGHVAPSEHLMHGARENQQLAIIIGQLQHLIQLAEHAIGRPTLAPVTFTIASPAASVTVDPPVAGCVLTDLTAGMDGANALGVTVAILSPSYPGGSRIVGSAKINENCPLSLPVEAYVPPDCTGIVITPASGAANWQGVLRFRPVIPGGYPYAG